MKRVILLAMLATVSIESFAQDQNDTVPTVKPFEDAASNLYTSKVIEIPGKTQKELNIQFKNWASTAFVSLKDVIVSETDNQTVLLYNLLPNAYIKMLGKSYNDIRYYVRVVAQFKDGKCKISFYDDGNMFSAGGIYNGIKLPDAPARTRYISPLVSMPKPETEKDLHKAKGFGYGIALSWEDQIDKLLLSSELGMKNASVSLAKKDDF